MNAAVTLVRTHARLRPAAAARLAGWSVLEATPVLLSGWLVARAVDRGFLAGRPLLGLGLIAMYGLLSLVRAVAERQTFPVLADLVESMRDRLVRSVVGAAIDGATGRAGSHSSRPDSAVVARLTGHVELVRTLLSALLRLSRPLLVSIVAALVGLATLAPALLVVVLPPLAVVALGYPMTWRALDRRRRRAVLAEERVAEVTGTVLDGLRDVRATGGAPCALAEVRAAAHDEVVARRALARLAGVRVLLETVGGRLPLFLLVAAAPLLLRNGLSAGQLIGAVTYETAYLTPAVSMLTGAISQYSTEMSAAAARLIATTAPGTPDVPDRAPSPAVGPAHVTVRGLHFAYPSISGAAADLLAGVDLTVAAGRHVALVGSSGAGKSTLAALLAGVERPGAGIVNVGGRSAQDARRARSTVLVAQEAYLVDGSVRENLTYLRAEADDARDAGGTPVDQAATEAVLDRACSAVGADRLVERLGGYDAIVVPDRLSGGERQLLVVARAYASTASLVVLDEATSLLDHRHEQVVERAFRARCGTTLVVVAHRLEAARRADEVVLVDDGRVSVGPHERLLHDSPRYAQLCSVSPRASVPVPAR